MTDHIPSSGAPTGAPAPAQGDPGQQAFAPGPQTMAPGGAEAAAGQVPHTLAQAVPASSTPMMGGGSGHPSYGPVASSPPGLPPGPPELVFARRPAMVSNPKAMPVSLQPAPSQFAADSPLNTVIRYHLNANGFEVYRNFMDNVLPMRLMGSAPGGDRIHALQPIRKIQGADAYKALRLLTEAFLLSSCGPTCSDWKYEGHRSPEQSAIWQEVLAEDREGLGSDDQRRMDEYLNNYLNVEGFFGTPYLRHIVNQLDLVRTSLGDPLGAVYASRYECPAMIELIWSYWHEEGMLSQTMNAVGLRFQNKLNPLARGRDPLANLEISPLRPVNSLLWGWIQSENDRLTVQRRAYEYDHHYGLTLVGRAVPQIMSVDSRTNFLNDFHGLLQMAHRYYEDRSDTTRIPDGFPLLNALRTLHLTMSEGAHNQFGDLPWTSRVEMLIEQYLLARPEMREFLRGRAMVPYAQQWMGQVDTMKKLQGWTDTSISHFHELAACGEAILLSVRHGPWAVNNNQSDAQAWADYWRPEIQRYVYAYRTVTDADLTLSPLDNRQPSRLLQARLARQSGLSAA